MNNTLIEHESDRTFQLWEYQVSMGQLLLRSPRTPASEGSPELKTNFDIVFVGVEYVSLPRFLRGVRLESATTEDALEVERLLGSIKAPNKITVIVSGEKRFHVVAAGVRFSENNWEIFDSPFEFRSRYRSHD